MSISLIVDIEEVKSRPDNISLLQNIKFQFDGPGVLWIQGPNGTGKSLISSIISGKAFISGSKLEINGKVEIKTEDNKIFSANHDSSARDYASVVSYWPQRVGSSLISIHHQDDLCSGLEARLRYYKNKDEELVSALQWLIEQFDLSPHLLKQFGQCSYGETRRFELATALSSNPSLIVADEPFAGLDEQWQKVLCRAIEIITKANNCIWVITGHKPAANYNIKPNREIYLQEKVCAQEAFNAISNEVVERMQKNNAALHDNISIHNLSIIRKKPEYNKVHLRNFSASPNNTTWLEGKNGSGKTTISNLLGGLIYSSCFNTVSINGTINGPPFNGKFIKAPRDDVRLLLQNPYTSFIRRNVYEDLEHILCPGDFRDNSSFQISNNLINTLKSHWGGLNRLSYSFSFGQLRFLQMLLIPPTASLIIFDEPFLGLHQNLHKLMYNTIEGISKTGRIVICTRKINEESPCSEFVYYLKSAA